MFNMRGALPLFILFGCCGFLKSFIPIQPDIPIEYIQKCEPGMIFEVNATEGSKNVSVKVKVIGKSSGFRERGKEYEVALRDSGAYCAFSLIEKEGVSMVDRVGGKIIDTYIVLYNDKGDLCKYLQKKNGHEMINIC